MQIFTLLEVQNSLCYSQKNTPGINKSKNKHPQQPEHFFSSLVLTSVLESLQPPLEARVRLPSAADLYCHKLVQVVRLCATFLLK